MGGWWGVVVAGGVLLAWSFYLDARHHFDQRLARWWLLHARGWGSATGLVSFVVSTAALLCFVVVAWTAHRVATGLQGPLWSLVVTGPVMLAYAPFVLATAPTQYAAYRGWRQELEEAGADDRQQRAIAWCAGPSSLGGMLAITATLFLTLAP